MTAERRSSAIEAHKQGVEAFEKKGWDDAINYYTSAIAFEKNPKFYANRSAAQLRKGDFDEALKDAELCIGQAPKLSKGYARKAEALCAMKKFDLAICAYKVGLAQCPDDKMLQKGLASTKRTKLGFQESTRGSMKAAHRGQASRRASVSLSTKAAKSADVSGFVSDARKAMQLEMTVLQSQMDLLDALAEMPDDAKLELLFNLLDKDGDGFVDAGELSDGIRKRNQTMTFAESLDRAMDMVSVFDEDGNAKLDQDEFKSCVDTLTKELGSNFHEFSEYVLLQMIFNEGNAPIEELTGALMDAEITAEVMDRAQMLDVLIDPRLEQLFRLFDISGDGVLQFKEVAIGMYQISSDMEGSIKATLDLLLMMDKDDKRTLDYDQFARLILSICAAAECSFDDIADGLTFLLSKDTVEMTEEDFAGLIISAEIYDAAKDIQKLVEEEEQVVDVLGYGRLLKLFDILDEDHDNAISVDELTSGLKRFQAAMGIDGDAELEAMLLVLGNDATGSSKLNREEFARAMVKYANAGEVEVHDLVDFMSVTSLIDSERGDGYQAAIRKSMTGDMLGPQVQVLYIELEQEDEFFFM